MVPELRAKAAREAWRYKVKVDIDVVLANAFEAER